jgi:diguanylate cyclase (GGDEF)-like protein
MQSGRSSWKAWAGLAGLSAVLGALLYWAWPGEPPASLSLRVGVYQNEPKIYRDEQGRPAGFFVRLLDEMAEREGWQLQWEDCRWQQCLDRLRAGELDLMPDVALSEGRRQALDFHAVPVVQAWSQLYRLPNHPVSSMADLAGQRIAVLEGSVQATFLREVSEREGLDFELVGFDHMPAVLASVGAGQADTAVSNYFYGRLNAADHQLVETPVTFDQVSLFYAAAGGRHDPVLARIDDYLQNWKSNRDSPYYAALDATIARSQREVVPGWILPALILGAIALVILAVLAGLMRWRAHHHSRELSVTSRQLRHLLDSSPVILYSLRMDDLHADWVSSNIERILHFTPGQALEPGWFGRHLHPDDRAALDSENRRLRETGRSLLEYRFRDARGQWRYLRDEKRRVAGPDSQQVIGSWTDLTESYRQQQRVSYLTQHDVRTGLPNRSLLADRIGQSIRTSPDAQFLVVLLDLDRFRNVNEHLGLAAGDFLLQTTGRRLSEGAGEEATVARVGSDEFCLFIRDPATLSERSALLDRLMAGIREPAQIDGQTVVIGASVGVACYPEHGRDHEMLLAAAELASQSARQLGGDRWQLYEPSMGERSGERLSLEHDLRRAIDANELRVHYQPQFALGERRMSGVEALVRWQHPERGLLGPGEFIGLAEEIGLIAQIDLWVVAEACRQLRAWQSAGLDVPRVAVNLSARQFYNDALIDVIAEQLSAHGLEGGRLELEITETMLMEFPDRALRVMSGLEQLGVRLSMDDFGSGYSNLAYLRRLPLHQLKIDQSLIEDIELSHHSRSIVRAIIAMARALELELVAEGIEDEVQLGFLRREGCSIGQGYLLSRPVTADRITREMLSGWTDKAN